MKNLKNGYHFVNIDHTENFEITNDLKVWVSSFRSVDEDEISASAIIKNLKNGHHFVNINRTNSTDPLKFGFLVF